MLPGDLHSQIPIELSFINPRDPPVLLLKRSVEALKTPPPLQDLRDERSGFRLVPADEILIPFRSASFHYTWLHRALLVFVLFHFHLCCARVS